MTAQKLYEMIDMRDAFLTLSPSMCLIADIFTVSVGEAPFQNTRNSGEISRTFFIAQSPKNGSLDKAVHG